MKSQLLYQSKKTLASIVRTFHVVLPLTLALSASAAAVDEAVLIDFGRHDGGNGAATASPDANGLYWNSWSGGPGNIPANASLTDLVTTNNSPTAISITAVTGFSNNGYVNGGLLTPDPLLLGEFAIGEATGDYYFVQGATASGTLRLSGLVPGRPYKLSMFATRITSNTDTRTTRYTVTDANGVHTVDLQTSGPGSGSTPTMYGNDDTIAELDQLIPNASGQLDLTVSVVNGGFAYIGILKITPLPVDLGFVENPVSAEVAAGTTVTFTAVANSSEPITYRWYFNDGLLPEETGTTLTLPDVTTENEGSYYATASNVFGVVTSAVATLTIGPDHISGFSVLVDFSRNDEVNGRDTISPDVNGRYWNNFGIFGGTVPEFAGIGGLVTISNEPTSISITVLSSTFQCNGRLNGGLLTPHYALLGDYAIPTATEDYFYLFNGQPGISGTLRISGLDPNTSYKLRMFGTRDTAETRTTRYSVTDVNGLHTVTLQTSGAGAGSSFLPNGNDDTIVSLNALVPNEFGELDLVISEVNGLYAYIGILEITTADEIPTFILHPQSIEVAPGSTATLTAYALSQEPLDYQWYFENNPIPGATETNLVLSDITDANVGSYYLVASNSLGVVTSSVATVILGPPHLPAAAVLLDLGRHDNSNGHETISPDANGNYWNNIGSTAITVPQGLTIANLVTVSGTPTTIGVTALSDNWQENGTQNGGLLAPHYSLLGDFAIPTATEDYFFVNNGSPGITGTLRIFGLNPALKYTFSMFATRNVNELRTTKYSVTDVNGLHEVNLQTSGTDAGSSYQPFGNDDDIVSLTGLVPNEAGELDLLVTEVNGLFAYLGVLQITPSAETTFTASPTPIDGGWRLQFNVGPGYSYRVQRATEVTGPWEDLGTFTGPYDGLATFDDTDAPATQAFYRIVVP